MEQTIFGTVVKCQVSAQPLVQDGRYIESDIIDASELHLGVDGVVGWCDGRAVLNHHHRLNPRLRTWKPNRLLSIGFTGHYGAMADRFPAAPLGCGAENVIVDCDRIVSVDDLAAGLQIRSADGATIDLEPAAVAKPCVPFTKFMLQDQDAEDELVAPNRAFLDNGMRGFVLGLANQSQSAVIRPGDELWTAG
ncbi:MAG: hypothetical protein ACR2QK_21925 [Acidimicrobiales bacterium]